MKKISIIIGIILLFTMCSDDQQKLDTRLADLEFEFIHIDPATSAEVKNAFSQTYKEMEDQLVDFTIKVKNKKVRKVDIISSSTQEMLATIENKSEINFKIPFNDLKVGLGQTDNMGIHIYFDDESSDFPYPSMKSVSFGATSYLEPLIYVKRQVGDPIPVTTTETDIERFYINENKGVTVEFIGNRPSYLRINKPEKAGDVDHLAFMRMGNFSFSFWIQMLDDYTNDPAMISTQDWASKNSRGFTITPRRNYGLALTIANGSSKVALEDDRAVIPTNKWTFITAVIDRSGMARIYEDAVLFEEKSVSSMSAVDLVPDGVQITINQDAKGFFKDRPHAEYSQIYFYDYLLTGAEVTEIFNNTK